MICFDCGGMVFVETTLFSICLCFLVCGEAVDYLSPCRWRRTGLEMGSFKETRPQKAIWLKTFKSDSLHITTLAPSSFPYSPPPVDFLQYQDIISWTFPFFIGLSPEGRVRKLFLWLISTFQKDVWDFKMRGQRDHYYASSVKVSDLQTCEKMLLFFVRDWRNTEKKVWSY